MKGTAMYLREPIIEVMNIDYEEFIATSYECGDLWDNSGDLCDDCKDDPWCYFHHSHSGQSEWPECYE